ncbi:MAG: hypothetical protein R6X25_13510 [Candidatus Krumholzibacteriia bacterium]
MAESTSPSPWDTVAAEKTLVWSMTPGGGPLQGPLDLAFVAGRRLHLVLDEDQVALLTRDGGVEAVYLTGRHDLDVPEGTDAVPLHATLVFMDLQRPWLIRWRRGTLLHLQDDDGGEHVLEVIGMAACLITDPTAFHRCFLAGGGPIRPEVVAGLLETLLRSRLEEHLSDSIGGVTEDLARVQSHLMALGGVDLADDLEPFGLACDQLSLYTASPPSEATGTGATGQFRDPLHNRL